MKTLRYAVNTMGMALLLALLSANVNALTNNIPSYYVTVDPCRILDTRLAGGAFGGGTTRSYSAWPEGIDLSPQGGKNTGCGIPPNATAIHANITAVGPTGFAYLRTWGWSAGEPNATVFAWDAGPGSTNALNIPLCSQSTYGGSCTHDFNIKIYSTATEIVVDVLGYYAPSSP